MKENYVYQTSKSGFFHVHNPGKTIHNNQPQNIDPPWGWKLLGHTSTWPWFYYRKKSGFLHVQRPLPWPGGHIEPGGQGMFHRKRG